MAARSMVSSLATAAPSSSQTASKVARDIRNARRNSSSGHAGLLIRSHHSWSCSLTQSRRPPPLPPAAADECSSSPSLLLPLFSRELVGDRCRLTPDASNAGSGNGNSAAWSS